MKENNQPIMKILLPYAGIMVILCIFAQVVIALRGSSIDFIAGLALMPAFIYYLYFNVMFKNRLSKVRFGALVAHVVGFLIVNLSYHIHAGVLVLSNVSNSQGPVVNLSPSWFGVLFGMFVFWGLGLLIHLIASISLNGFEELEI